MLPYLLIMIGACVAAYGYWQYHYKYNFSGYIIGVAAAGLTGIVIMFKMNFIIFMLLAMSFIIGYSMRRRRAGQMAWQGIATGTCGILAFILGVGNLMYNSTGCEAQRIGDERIIAIERYALIQMEYLGQYLGKRFPQARILLINSPDDRLRSQKEDALRRGLDGKGKIESKAMPHFKESSDPEMTLISSFTAAALDRMVKRHPKCSLVLCAIPLPVDHEKVTYWQKPPRERPITVVILRSPSAFSRHIKDGRIAAAVAPRPGARVPYGRPIPDDLETAFNSRYIILAAEEEEQGAKE